MVYFQKKGDKHMKKLLAVLLTAVLLIAAALPVCAESGYDPEGVFGLRGVYLEKEHLCEESFTLDMREDGTFTWTRDGETALEGTWEDTGEGYLEALSSEGEAMWVDTAYQDELIMQFYDTFDEFTFLKEEPDGSLFGRYSVLTAALQPAEAGVEIGSFTFTENAGFTLQLNGSMLNGTYVSGGDGTLLLTFEDGYRTQLLLFTDGMLLCNYPEQGVSLELVPTSLSVTSMGDAVMKQEMPGLGLGFTRPGGWLFGNVTVADQGEDSIEMMAVKNGGEYTVTVMKHPASAMEAKLLQMTGEEAVARSLVMASFGEEALNYFQTEQITVAGEEKQALVYHDGAGNCLLFAAYVKTDAVWYVCLSCPDAYTDILLGGFYPLQTE